jgi:hypothetical protein
MEIAVCDVNNELCMTHKCDKCKGRQGILHGIQSIVALLDMDNIIFNQWMTTD